MVLNKIDLLPYVPFDMEAARRNARSIHPDIEIIETSCTAGNGLGLLAPVDRRTDAPGRRFTEPRVIPSRLQQHLQYAALAARSKACAASRSGKRAAIMSWVWIKA